MSEHGNPNSASDAGVAALAVRAAIRGAWLNVTINAQSLHKHPEVESILQSGKELLEKSLKLETQIIERVESLIRS